MADRDLSMGPREGQSYPLKVQYCGNCSMPTEYCEYYPEYEKCKQWLEKHLPTEFEKVKLEESPEEISLNNNNETGNPEGDSYFLVEELSRSCNHARCNAACVLLGWRYGRCLNASWCACYR